MSEFIWKMAPHWNKAHAVRLDIKHARALCGVQPWIGWMDDSEFDPNFPRCKRCLALSEKYGRQRG